MQTVAHLLLVLLLCTAACSAPSRLEQAPGELPGAKQPLVIAIEGALSLDKRDLEADIARTLDDYVAADFREAFLDDAAYQLEQSYRDLGFLSATVGYELQSTEAGARVVFTVSEGPRAVLGEFEVSGAEAFSAEQLRARFDFPSGSWNEEFRSFYSPAAWRAGVAQVRELYASSGYMDFVLVEPALRLEEDGQLANLNLKVVEGRAYRLADVEFDTEGKLPAARLREIVSDRLGQPFTPRLAVEVRNLLIEEYAASGYPYATVVTPRTIDPRGGDQRTGEVVLRARVVPGPLVKIGTVLVPQEARTRPSFLRDRLGIEPGDTYDRREVRKGFSRLYRTGLFEAVRIELVGESSREAVVTRDLVLEVDEAKHQEIFVEPGYGSFEHARLSGGYRQRNLFGTGRGLRVEGLIAERARSAEIGISDPALFGSRWIGDASVLYELRERPSFTREQFGFELVVTWPITSRWQLSTDYSFRRSKVSDVAVDPASDPALADALSGVDIASVTLAPGYDSRDRLFTPNSGVYARLGIEWAASGLGSQLDFLRPTMTASGFWPLAFVSDGTVLGATLQGGLIVPLASTDDIPINERFFNGGGHTVRAFEEDQLGPVDSNGEPLGGEVLHLGSIEVRQELLGRLHTALYYDIGNVKRDYNDALDFSGLRGGPGIGLRYLLPVGPIRLDLGFNPDPRLDESRFVWHFSVGMAF